MCYYPLPHSLGEILQHPDMHCSHPGLLLDRFVPHPSDQFDKFEQTHQFKHLRRIADLSAPPQADEILGRWDSLATALHGTPPWQQTTLWRLALHLSRPTALENAGFCLHPVYGFAYLPGPGLKGLAKAYAEQERGLDCSHIFGTTDARGTVTFLDAWPTTWPRLELDIVNNHHREYYAQKGALPPGDWESPVPVYFLAVAPGTSFRFTVVPAPGGQVPDADLHTAATLLQQALSYLGAGAKTGAGYGYFGEPEPAG